MTSITEPAPSQTDITASFKCEDYEEYLLIDDEAASSLCGGSQPAAPQAEQQVEGNEVVNRGGSPDSGYEGKGWSSPAEEGKQTQGVEPEGDIEEWCIVEVEKHRPQGLYGYRYVEYDDNEAEGNIHITDEDL